jgi:pyruvate/2-oxoglutarate/acetoin dehydrogenase E1 component
MTDPRGHRRLSFAGALYEAIRDSLREDRRMTVLGNWVFGLQFNNYMDALREEFTTRIVEPPVAEAAMAAVGVGAAMAGAPTFVDLATGSFSFLAWSPIVNEASIVHYLSNGQLTAPVVFHLMHGIRGGGGPQHSFSPQAMLWNVPGLELVMPSTPYEAKGLMRRAIKSRNPTAFVDHTKLMAMEGEVPEEDYEIPFGVAEIKRPGRDVTLVATSHQVHLALSAAEQLASEGIEVEVVDPRTLVPFDEATILDSVRGTGRLAVLDECSLRCGVASEIVATVSEKAFGQLKTAPIRLARPDVPVPFSSVLEAEFLPDLNRVVSAIRAQVGSGGPTGR